MDGRDETEELSVETDEVQPDSPRGCTAPLSTIPPHSTQHIPLALMLHKFIRSLVKDMLLYIAVWLFLSTEDCFISTEQ